MRQFLLRVTLFSGLQGLLLAGFLWLTSAESTMSDLALAHSRNSAIDTPHLTGEERIKRFLHDYLFAAYRGDDRIFDGFLSSPASVRAAAMAYSTRPNNYLAALIDKDERLKSVTGPRMIFVGGSGLAFGIDSHFLRERYPYEPINYGLHAFLGGDFMLRHVRDHLRSGDVVVLCFEHFVLYHYFNTALLREQLRDVTPAFDHYFGEPNGPLNPGRSIPRWEHWKQYADAEALSDLAAFLRGRIEQYEHVSLNPPSWRASFDAAFNARCMALKDSFRRYVESVNPAYQRSSFNAYGDGQGHRRSGYDFPPVDKSKWQAQILTPEFAATLQRSVASINAFTDDCRQKGVQVMFTYSPLAKIGDFKKFAAQYSAVVETHLKVKPLFPIDETYFDLDLFFDTEHHLTWEGTRRRMTILARALDEHFPVQTTMPVEVHLAERERRIFAELPQTAARDGNLVR